MTNQLLLGHYKTNQARYSRDSVFELAWLRASAEIKYWLPQLWVCLGDVGTGKSSLQESVAEAYARNGAKILDLMSAQDNEGLGFCRAPFMKGKRILLLTGERTKIKMTKEHYDQKRITEVSLRDLEWYDCIVNVYAFYESPAEYFELMKPLLEMIYTKRTHWVRDSAQGVIFCIVREAANLMYSRIKNTDQQKEAKNQVTYLLREARHSGLSLSIDTLKLKSIESDIRRPASYICIKAQGFEQLPDTLSWVYTMVSPTWVANMKPDEVLFLAKENSAVGVGYVAYPEFHKEENEDILEILGLEAVTNLQESSFKEKQKDFTPEKVKFHTDIVNLTFKKKQSHRQIRETLNLGSLSPIEGVLREHSVKINMNGYCSICRAGGCEFDKTQIRNHSEALRERVKQNKSFTGFDPEPVEVESNGN